MTRKLKPQQPNQPANPLRSHFQKPLSNDQKINNLSHHIDQLYKALGDVNSRLIALCRAKLPAGEMAKFMLDAEANNLYMKNLNSSLEYEAKKESDAQKEKLKGFIPKEGEFDEPLPEATV